MFLKIVEQDGKYALLYSERFHHHHSVVKDIPGRPLLQISVRIAMLNLLYRTSHEGNTQWHTDTSLLKGKWTEEHARGNDGKEAPEYKSSPFKNVKECMRKGFQSLSLALRKRRAGTPIPATLDYNGTSLDGQADETYVDTDTPVKSNRPAFPKISPAPSNSSYLGQSSHALTWNREKNRDALDQLRRSNRMGPGAWPNIATDDLDA